MRKNDEFLHIKYYSFGATGSGETAADPASPIDSDVLAIPAGACITGVDVIVTSAVTGTITIGDDDDPDGYATSTEVTEGTIGAYAGNGDYLTGGLHKYYPAVGKEVKLDQTTISAGAFAVVVRGFCI